MILPRRQLSCLGLINNGNDLLIGVTSDVGRNDNNTIDAGASTLVDGPASTRGAAAT